MSMTKVGKNGKKIKPAKRSTAKSSATYVAPMISIRDLSFT